MNLFKKNPIRFEGQKEIETQIKNQTDNVISRRFKILMGVIGVVGVVLLIRLFITQISQQEYEDLNKGLDTYTSFITQKSELQQATWAVMRQTAEATRQKIESGASEEEMEIYAQQVKDTWKDKINAFLEENSYDKTVLDKMISLVREGKSLSFDQKA